MKTAAFLLRILSILIGELAISIDRFDWFDNNNDDEKRIVDTLDWQFSFSMNVLIPNLLKRDSDIDYMFMTLDGFVLNFKWNSNQFTFIAYQQKSIEKFPSDKCLDFTLPQFFIVFYFFFSKSYDTRFHCDWLQTY